MHKKNRRITEASIQSDTMGLIKGAAIYTCLNTIMVEIAKMTHYPLIAVLPLNAAGAFPSRPRTI